MAALLSVKDARARITETAAPADKEPLPIMEAFGRTLAAPVAAAHDQPPFNASAMDGYAVRFADASKAGAHLRLIGEARAGVPFMQTLKAGETARIFTGGVVPPGADHILLQEEAERTGDDAIRVTVDQSAPSHIRAAGIDVKAGAAIAEPGDVLVGALPALIAAAGVGEVMAARPPNVSLLTTGDEIVPAGTPLRAGQVSDATSASLAGLIARWGGAPVHRGHASDTEDSLRERLAAAREAGADILVPIGGASVGDYDLVKGVLGAEGMELLFAGVAVKPGKPLWLGRLGDMRVLGLPGNPASALACAHLFLKVLIRASLGARAEPEVETAPARLAHAMQNRGGRETYARALVYADENGQLAARQTGSQDSSLLKPFADANALLRLQPRTSYDVGDVVDVMFLDAGLSAQQAR